LHDRDTKYSAAFRAIIETGHVKTLSLPARSPNLNAYAEQWVRSVKDECLSKIVLFGDRSLRRAVSEYVAHYHTERNHHGKSNVLLFPDVTEMRGSRPVRCRERLGWTSALLPSRGRVNPHAMSAKANAAPGPLCQVIYCL
jgi:hypothetical protein